MLFYASVSFVEKRNVGSLNFDFTNQRVTVMRRFVKPAPESDPCLSINSSVDKLVRHKSGLPFSLLFMEITELKRCYVIPKELLPEINGYSHILAIYFKPPYFKKERLLYFQTDARYRSIPEEDLAGRIIQKMKLIAHDGKFCQGAEQELGLSVGFLNRPQFQNQYRSKSISEVKFFSTRAGFAIKDGAELVHIMVWKRVDAKNNY